MELIKDISYGIKKNDMNVAKAVFKGYSGKVSGICHRYLKDKGEVDLIVENVFLDFFNFIKKGSYNNSEDRKIMPVLKELTLRILISYYVNSSEEKTFDPHPDYKERNDDQLYVNGDSLEIVKAFDVLSIFERFVLNMCIVEEYSISHIADTLKENTDTIEQCYASAKTKLLKKIREKYVLSEK